MRLIKAKNVNCVLCDNGSRVCYNTIFNKPIILDKNSYEYFSSKNEFDLRTAKQNSDEWELINVLIDSYLLVSEEDSEEKLLDELSAQYLKKVVQGKTIEFFDLRISERCNFGCGHCISSKAQSGEDMTLQTAKQAIDFVIAFICERKPDFSKLDIHYGNAEPLMNFSVLEKVHNYLTSTYPNIEKSCSINTNLSLLTEGKARFFINNGIAIYGSLDGIKEANDSIRIFKNGKGTYDLIIEKIALLKKLGRKLEGISVTITEKNFKYFDLSFVDWCAERGYWSLAIDFDLVNSLNIPMDERVDFLASMWKRCKQNNMEFFGTWITPFLNLSNRSIVDKHYAFCKGVHGKSISVAPNGQVYICGSSSTAMGNFCELSSMLSEQGSIYRAVSSHLVGRNKMCKGCVIEGACAGQCFVTAEFSQENRQRLCDFYRAITEKLLTIQAASDWQSE